MAASPLLVLYSRFARPYAFIFLLVAIGMLGYVRFREHGSWRSALTANSAVGLALFFNLSAVSGALAIWGIGIVLPGDATNRRTLRRRWLLSAGFGILLAALLLAPSIPQLAGFVGERAGDSELPTTAWTHLPASLIGIRGTVPMFLFIAIMVAGAVRLCRQYPPLGWLSITIFALQAATILVLRPTGIQSGIVLTRYMMCALPGVLLFLTAGILWSTKAAFRGSLPGRPDLLSGKSKAAFSRPRGPPRGSGRSTISTRPSIGGRFVRSR